MHNIDMVGTQLGRFLSHRDWIMQLTMDDQKIISASCDGTVRIWTHHGTLVYALHTETRLSCVAFDNTRIIVGCYDDEVALQVFDFWMDRAKRLQRELQTARPPVVIRDAETRLVSLARFTFATGLGLMAWLTLRRLILDSK